jgi:(heptosyl)LPS beta-1,4-glucosyltransferase
MNPISIIIVVKHNPPHLFESLDSIKDFGDEIIIVDIGIDQTLKEKLKKFPRAKIVNLEEDVPYVELIREKVKQYAKNEYLLYLDPDEILPEALKIYVARHLTDYDYFVIPRKNFIFGRWIKHSRWWPDCQIRIFKKNAVVWPQEIHKQPTLTGKGLTITAEEQNAIIHHNYESIDEYLEKAKRYAKAEAISLTKREKSFTLEDAFKKSISEFISRYFAQEGYKDGMHGFVLSILQMFYSVLVFVYYWELHKYESAETALTTKVTRNFFAQGLVETNHWLLTKKLLSQSQQFKTKVANFLIKRLNK